MPAKTKATPCPHCGWAPGYVSITKASQIAKVTRQTIFDWAKESKIETAEFLGVTGTAGRRFWVKESSLRAFVDG